MTNRVSGTFDQSEITRHLCAWALAFVLYFGFGLLIKVLPSLGSSFLFFLYELSIPVVLLILAVFFACGALATLISVCRGSTTSQTQRLFMLVPVLAVILLLGSFALRLAIPDPLPTGSDLLPFDAAEWPAPDAAAYAGGNPTSRQKMLANLLERLDPSLTRGDIEAMLGEPDPRDFPLGSGDSDIHYRTGPQRDAFLGLGSEWLLIWFDESGHFERYEIEIYTD